MTAFTGTFGLSYEYEDVLSGISVNIRNLDDTPMYDEVYDEPTISESGSLTDNLPIALNTESFDGAIVPSFLNDYYYRIHIEPNPIELGAILSQIIETVQVWNAYFVSKQCSSIDSDGATELTLLNLNDPQLSPPFTLAALGIADYQLTIPADGSPNLEAEYEFVFPDESPSLIITGQRIVLFGWRPEQPLTETLEWLTNIITAKDGSEQRIALRDAPRQGFALNVITDDELDQSKIEAALFGWQKRIWGVPVWPHYVLHTADINIDDETISVDTTNRVFDDGGLAVIWQGDNNYEVVKINTVSDTSLTLNSPVLNNWTGRKLIIPVKTANMITKASRKDAPKDVSWLEVQFLTRGNLLISGYSAATTYDSIPVITDPSYVLGDSLEKESDAVIHITDFGTGDVEVISDRDYNLESHKHTFINEGRANCFDFRKFLHWLKGRQKVVWIPSFKEDMQLASTIGASDNTITINNIGYIKHYQGNEVKKHIMLLKSDGTQIYREITGSTAGAGDTEVLNIDSAVGEELAPTDVTISFMKKCRLDSDRVEINWDDINSNVCTAPFVGVKE